MGSSYDNNDDFASSGPKHMMVKSGTGSSPTTMVTINWDSNEHRRCIAACLVKGTYVMEKDRILRRLGTRRALAPAWWESFQFRLRDVRDVLDCECDCVFCRNRFKFGAQRWSIYGAILEHAPPAGERRHPSAPRYVVAFRGTMPPWHRGDMSVNVEILFNRQHDCRRFRHARSKVDELLDSIVVGSSSGSAAVWLAGHSLGASVALDVGRHLMTAERRARRDLPAFLFNPPQVSVAPLLNTLRVPDVARRFLYRVSYTVKAKLGATAALGPLERKMEELFERLAPWVPELYVHDKDFICRGFIDYFEQRQNMLGGSSQAAMLGTRLSLRDMLLFLHDENKEGKQVQPHLLPSARLWKTSVRDIRLHRHGLQQWWQPDTVLNLNPGLYSYRGE